MDPELQFPNPVERHDLPVPRKKWKYILSGGVVLLLLMGIFLPQILSSKVGKNLIKAYLESQYRGQAFMTSFKTSWRGPTIVTKFSITDPEGRQIRFNSLNSPVSLWGLLFGTVDLGDAEIDGLYIEYVVDYGDGTSSVDRWPSTYSPATTNAIAPPGGATTKSLPKLPDISGNITLKNTQIIVTRGQIQPRQFRAVYRSMRFSAPTGKAEIASLDRPWKVTLDGKVGPDDQAGTFTVYGTLDLGEAGKLDWKTASADLSIAMRDVPNVSTDEVSTLGWLLFPAITSHGHEHALGPVVKTLEMHIKGEEGHWQFEKLEAVGKTLEGKETRVSGRPILQLDRTPIVLSVNEPATVSVALTPDLAAYLSYVNPFLRDSADGAGWVDVTLTEAALPLAAVQKTVRVRGEATVRDAALASGLVLESDPWPKELTTQWQAISGNVAASPIMQMPKASFSVSNGMVSVEPYDLTIDGAPVRIEGATSLKGNVIDMNARLASATGFPTISAEIDGTLDLPKLTLKSASTELTGAFEKNMLALRQRKSEKLLEVSNKRVEGLLEVYDRINRKGEK